MNHLERVGGTEGVKIIIGSGFFWAWMDGLFMSAFFITEASQGFMSELAFITVFMCAVPTLFYGLVRRGAFSEALSSKRFMVIMAALGCLGSLLFIAASIFQSMVLVFAGGLFGGLFMAVFSGAWGACYCAKGAQSAMPYVMGAFAFALLVDIPLLLMVPQASAAFFAILPVATCVFFLLVKPDEKAYGPESSQAELMPHKISTFISRYLGISVMLLGAVVLVTFGFGYLQHLISFSPVMDNGALGGIAIQLARGVFSVCMFSMCLIAPRKMGIVYRMGFLAMVAGIMMIPFFSNGSFFVVPGAIIIAGYTVFDAFIWVVFCQVAQEKSEDPLKTVIFIRLIASFFSAVGAIVGVLLVGADGVSVDSSSHATTLVGYFIVIAIVLILSGEDSRWIFASAAVSYARMPRGMAEGLQEERPFDSWLEGSGLTAREKEIAGLLVQGRTQPWIAESLGISENTVGTHVRHIYQKTDVHDRQHFIDQALCNFSPESRDGENHLTEHA